MASETAPAAEPPSSPAGDSASADPGTPASNARMDESPSEKNGEVEGEKAADDKQDPDEDEEESPDVESSVLTNGKGGPSSPSHAMSSPRRVSKRIKIRRKSRPTPKIFHDAISVVIPVDVTADLKTAIQRTRAKRIQSIYKRFPALKKAVKKWKNQHPSHDDDSTSKADDPMDEDEDAAARDPNAESSKTEGKENNKPNKKKKKILAHVPQPEQYGSVLDYLEAKYVRGVMLGDDEADGESMDDGSEGQGSVYSQGSFLDDTDLQRDVAEQVMANTTLTKLELENEDGEFFVNVGALEVEDNQYGDNYDPVQDKDASKAVKKRKKSQASAATDISKGSIKKKKKGKTVEGEDSLAQSSKSKKSVTSTGTVKKKQGRKPKNGGAESSPAKEGEKSSGEEKEAIAKAKKAKAKSDAMFKKFSALVKKMTPEDLPRRKTKAKVSLTCPPNKKPGDDVTFTNPHNKGQRLRVKVPKDCLPGEVFKVSVPVNHDPEDESDDKDHNTFSRELQELVDDYARVYDNWCSAQAEVDKKFALFKEKQAKFDPLVELFPKNLMTPVTVEYMKKIVRRARQNRHKRLKTASLKSETTSKDGEEVDGDESEKEEMEEEEEQEDEEESPAEPQKRIVEIPTMGSEFPTLRWKEADFISTIPE